MVSWLSGGKAAAAREKSAGREGGHAAVATRWFIAHLVRDFLNAVNESHLVKGIDQGRKATVHAENPAVDNRGDIHAVENIAARLPNRGAAIPAQRVIKMKDASPHIKAATRDAIPLHPNNWHVLAHAFVVEAVPDQSVTKIYCGKVMDAYT